MPLAEPDDESPLFSVIIGLVSRHQSRRILQVLASLHRQRQAPRFEIIVCDRLGGDVNALISARYPQVQLLCYPATTTLPQLRSHALDRARGTYVAVIEDHCVPAPDWLHNMLQAFEQAPANTVAVAGCVENGACDSALDWACFFCEYSALLAPISEGSGQPVAGMNIAYRRAALLELPRARLEQGFWETTVHPLFAQRQLPLWASNRIVIHHSKSFSFGFFMSQRYLYSRYYAAGRFAGRSPLLPLLAALLTPLLPLILGYRSCRDILVKRRLYLEFISALPILLLFHLSWAAGEMAGYLSGAGDALSRIE